jgi:hypothetical protein
MKKIRLSLQITLEQALPECSSELAMLPLLHCLPIALAAPWISPPHPESAAG